MLTLKSSAKGGSAFGGKPHNLNLRLRSGQTIIEAIVAISVLLGSFLGIFNLLSTSLHNNRVIAENSSATYLAAEGIEIVKNILDHDVIAGFSWGTGVPPGDFEADYSSAGLSAYAGRNLFFNATNNLYDYNGTGVSTNFKRRIRIATPAPEEIVVNSIVSWTTGSAQSSVNLEEHFLNWRP